MTALTLRDRVRGALLGGAVGDALGAPVEFLSLDAIRARYGPDGIGDLDIAYGRRGAITDDTQMTLFTAEGLLVAAAHAAGAWDGVHRLDVPRLLAAYRRWLRTQDERPLARDASSREGWLLDVPELHARRAPGNTCLAALRTGRAGSPEHPLNGSKGCGGVMRAAPAGLVRSDAAFALGARAAAITHGHPTGWLAAGALAEIVRGVVWDGLGLPLAVEAARARLAREPGHEETSLALGRAVRAWRAGPPSAERIDALRSGDVGAKAWGIAEDALAIAVYAALGAEGDVARGLRLAVNHSDDSDSTGAIAGNLLGALHGERAMLAGWRDGVELREVILRVADDLAASHDDDHAWRHRYGNHLEARA